MPARIKTISKRTKETTAIYRSGSKKHFAGKIAEFRRVVWKHYRTLGRDALPWRHTRDPYRILVSEVMLQQTQVERVLRFYEAWLKKFPDVFALAKAPLAEVLKLWQGLGYNRRAKMLHEAAKAVVKEYGGVFPESPEALEKLPGIGHYTSRAVCAFAHNADVVFIETNLRTVVTHYFFPRKKTVDDRELLKILEKALPKGKAREWYAALMDYGAYLKRNGVRINANAKGYVKQKTFEGSLRQARGAILRALMAGSKNSPSLLVLMGPSRKTQMRTALSALLQEKMVERTGNVFKLPD